MNVLDKNSPVTVTISILIALVFIGWGASTYAYSIINPIKESITKNETEIKLILQQMSNDSDRLERIEEKLDKALWL